MSTSDRLSQVRARIIRAREGRHTDRHMMLDVDAPAMVNALRAVIEVCNESTIEARPYGGGKPYMIVPVREVHAAISAALGEES